MFKNKLKKIHNEGIYHKLSLLVKLRLLEGPLFIHALIQMIELSKQIFVLHLEKGQEVVVPKQLREK